MSTLSGVFGWLLPLSFVLAGLAVIAVVALLTLGRIDAGPDVSNDVPPLDVPADGVLGRSDIDEVRFAVGLRGYRMDQVDVVLDRLSYEVAEREAVIAQLRQELAVAESHDTLDDFTGPLPVVTMPAATLAPAPTDEPPTPYGAADPSAADRPPA